MTCPNIQWERWQCFLFRQWCASKTQYWNYGSTFVSLISDTRWGVLERVLENSIFHVWSHSLPGDSYSVSWYLRKTVFQMYTWVVSHTCATFIHTYQNVWLFPHLFPFQRYVCICAKNPVSRFTLVLNKEALKEMKWYFQDKYNQDVLNFTLSWNLCIEMQSSNQLTNTGKRISSAVF